MLAATAVADHALGDTDGASHGGASAALDAPELDRILRKTGLGLRVVDTRTGTTLYDTLPTDDTADELADAAGSLGDGTVLERDGHAVVTERLGADGMEACRTLRAPSDVPVLMVTARTSDDDKIRGLGLGADDYVEKPFSPGVLVARVEARLRRYAQIRGMSDEVVRTSHVTIDTARRRVEVDGRVVELRTKEYELLLFLARNAERVLGRDLLYERVWGPAVRRTLRPARWWATRPPSRSTSSGCATRSSATRRTPSSSRPCAGRATAWRSRATATA